MNQPDFYFEIKYSEYGYTEFYIPPNEDGKFRIPGNAYYQWPTKKDVAIWALPNPEGDFNIAVYMKLKGPNSFEYFKNKPQEFENYINEVFPDSKTLMPGIKHVIEKFGITRLINVKCYPWTLGKFTLMGDAAHSMNPFTG